MGADAGGVAHHVEVEIKFDVAPGIMSPSFDDLPEVSRSEKRAPQSLDAVYYDTPGHDLAMRWVTLRRRTGGHDAGWHLKLPDGPDGRTEVRAPLETATTERTDYAPGTEVPAGLVDVVRAIVRDRPLVPVARIGTTRMIEMLYGVDGAALAEFADDEVSAWRIDPQSGAPGAEQRWHEWELEIVENRVGDGRNAVSDAADLLDRIGGRLQAAGAVPAAHGSKLAKVLGTQSERPGAGTDPPPDPVHAAILQQIDELLQWDRAMRADTYDAVHQMRVTTRKIRSLLQASEDAFGLTDDAWILNELRELAGILGVARDAEVLAERYERALAALPPDLVRGPVRERLVGGAQRVYQAGHRRSLTAMRSTRYFRLLDALEALAHDPPRDAQPQRRHAPIDTAYRRLRKEAAAVAVASEAQLDHGSPDHEQLDHALHQLRKRAKRLRYIAAAVERPDVAEPAKTIQSLLGDHQDSVVSRAHLGQEALAAHAAGEDTFTYGLLYQQEEELARRSREQLDAAMQALERSMRPGKKKKKKKK